MDVLFDEIGLSFFHNEQPALAGAKGFELFVHEWVGHIQHIQRNFRLTESIRQAQHLQGAEHAVVQAALHDDAEILGCWRKEFIDAMVLNEFDGSRPAVLHLFLLVQIARWGQHNAVDITFGMLDGIFQREFGAHIVFGGKLPVHMACPNAQFQHDRRVAGLRQLKAFFNGLHDAWQIGSGVQQPNLRFHGECMRALLHDAGALAVVFAHYDHGPANHPTRGQIGQSVRRHIGAHR